MESEGTDAYWSDLKFEEPTEFRAGEFLVKKYELNFNKLRGGFDDMINLLEADFKKFVLVGTEKGKIFVVDMRNKRVLSVIQSDTWLNSIFLSKTTVMASGLHRRIEGYSLRAKPCLFRYDSRQQQAAFGSKGVVFQKVNNRSFVIANTGFLRFTIFNSRSRKIVRTFQIPPHFIVKNSRAETGPEPSKRVILNYSALKVSGVICFMLKGDAHLYFFNCKTQQLLHVVKLFSQEDLGSAMFLANTVMLPCGDFILVILQFRRNSESSKKVKTILYVHQVVTACEKQRILYHFFLDLKDFEIIYSHDIKPVTNQVMGVDKGFTLILGTSVGVSRCIVVDLQRQTYVPRTVIRKSNISSPRLPRRRNLRDSHLQQWHHECDF